MDLRKVIEDSNYVIELLYESVASSKAKRLGLVHLGFGKYGPAKGESATMTSVKGKLVKVKKKSSDTGQTLNTGITNIKKVSGSENIFTYEFNKDKKKIILTKAEYASFVGKSFTLKQIIEARIEKEEKKKKEKDNAKTKKQK